MASITFSGQLDQAMNEAAAEGNKILFIPQQTVGEVLPGAASELVVESDGSYSITLAYNTYSIHHYSDVTKKRTLIANGVVVSADTAVSTIPDLIGSTVPVTEDSVLTIQGYLTDAQNSASAAATSETNAAESEANAAESASSVSNRVADYEVESTEYLISTFDGSSLDIGDVVQTLGYSTKGDGGGSKWIKTGETGTASQSPSDTGSYTCSDTQGIEYKLSLGCTISYDGENKIFDLGFGDYGTGRYTFNGSSFDSLMQRETQRDKFEYVRYLMNNGDDISITAIGDSITWGSDGNNPGTQVTNPWPSLLESYLQQWFDNENISVTNHGYSGYDSSQILSDYIDDIVAEDSDMYLIAIGVNDARTDRGISPEDYYQNLMEIYSKLSGKAIAFISLTPVYQNGTANSDGVVDYRSAEIKAANDLGVTYIDTYSELMEFIRFRSSARGRVNGDRLHWSQEGYEVIAANIFRKGFVGKDFSIKSGQYMDSQSDALRGSDWLNSTTVSEVRTLKYLTDGGAGKLFIYNDNYELSKLVAHVRVGIYDSTENSRDLTVLNNSTGFTATYQLTITDASESNYVDGYPLPICDLMPGMNIIDLSVGAGMYCRFAGFSVAEMKKDCYSLTSSATSAESKYKKYLDDLSYSKNKYGFETLVGRMSVGYYDYNSGIIKGLVVPDDDELRVRIKGYFVDGTQFRIGGAPLDSFLAGLYDSLYASPLYIEVNSSATRLYFVKRTGDSVQLSSLSQSFGDLTIDIISNSSGTTFYVNGSELGSIPLPLPVFDLSFVGNNTTSNESIIEFVSLIGSDVTPGDDIPGEKFIEYTQAKEFFITPSGNRFSTLYTSE